MEDLRRTPGPDLPDLVGSRLCHDLVNPLSAIANGLELLSLSGAAKTPEMDLIGAALDDAMARLRFFRVAFGAARDGDTLSERELREILSAVYAGGRLTVEWEVTGDLPRRDARCAFLMLNCAETALPLGGTLHVRRDDGWVVSGEGRKLKIDDDLWAGLTAPAPAPPPARVQFALLARDASERGLALSFSVDLEANALCLQAKD